MTAHRSSSQFQRQVASPFRANLDRTPFEKRDAFANCPSPEKTSEWLVRHQLRRNWAKGPRYLGGIPEPPGRRLNLPHWARCVKRQALRCRQGPPEFWPGSDFDP